MATIVRPARGLIRDTSQDSPASRLIGSAGLVSMILPPRERHRRCLGSIGWPTGTRDADRAGGGADDHARTLARHSSTAAAPSMIAICTNSTGLPAPAPRSNMSEKSVNGRKVIATTLLTMCTATAASNPPVRQARTDVATANSR